MIYLTHTSKGYSVFELVSSFLIIFILIGTFGTYAFKVVVIAKEIALQNELANLRLSVELYKAFNGGYPEDLNQVYEIPDYFVTIDRLDKEGNLLDPFGKRYYYNPITGRLRSQTEKYKKW